MPFKLVRIDTVEATKIQLEIGKQIIGRGRFLHDDDQDKRVSRNHAELEVTDDSITLKSLHQNPCFYIKTSTTETKLLNQNSTIDLSNGDKFGLLPDNFWYQVINTDHSVENGQNDNDVSKSQQQDHSVCDGEETEVQNNDNIAVTSTANKQEETVLQNNDNSTASNEEETAVHNNDNSAVNDAVNSTTGDEEVIDFQIKDEPLDSDRTTSPALLNPESTEEYNPEPQVPVSSPLKREASRESSPEGVKRVKTEPTTPGNDQAGPSNDANQADSKPDAPASPAKPPSAPARERCIYGANCYRRNPAHKAQFSHPADSDWGAGARGICPYGATCRRHEPRHWTTHDHPPGTNPPNDQPRNRPPGMQVVQRHGNMYYINAHSVNFYDDHFQVEDSDGDSVDYDYEF